MKTKVSIIFSVIVGVMLFISGFGFSTKYVQAADSLLENLMASTTRISVSSDGVQGDYHSFEPSISADGRFISFASDATNLVPDDTNQALDIFVHDQVTGETSRISIRSDGIQANEGSYFATISVDGRFVSFSSWATNLVEDDTNGWDDIFVHDRMTGQTERVSVASDGGQANGDSYSSTLSGDGRFVVFDSWAQNLTVDNNFAGDVFVHDRDTGMTELISRNNAGIQGNHGSGGPKVSENGRYVAYYSYANNLVENDTNDVYDIFVYDRETGLTERVSVASDGTQANGESLWPAISADGRYVSFGSRASNLVENDTNGVYDTFVHDRETGRTERVSISSEGVQGNSISGSCSLSADGRFVGFDSFATNLIENDSNGVGDGFIHDRLTGQTIRITIADDGTEGNEWSSCPMLSADGRYSAFEAEAFNLVINDTNEREDVFVRDRGVAPTVEDILLLVELIQVNDVVQAEAEFTYLNLDNTHTAIWDWGDNNTSSGSVTEANGSGTVSGNHAYGEAGVYTITLSVTDSTGNTGLSKEKFIVVYDPSAGYISGLGTIYSPPGAYASDATLEGTANFAFVSRYQPGAHTPTGKTQFIFQTANLKFYSDSYDWLVVAGAKAMYKGTGTINGSGNYGFMLTAVDEKFTPSTDVDLFRIKIWDKDTDTVIYDNQMGADDNADPTTTITSGKIVIHK